MPKDTALQLMLGGETQIVEQTRKKADCIESV
jgi:hypothetical protein